MIMGIYENVSWDDGNVQDTYAQDEQWDDGYTRNVNTYNGDKQQYDGGEYGRVGGIICKC